MLLWEMHYIIRALPEVKTFYWWWIFHAQYNNVFPTLQRCDLLGVDQCEGNLDRADKTVGDVCRVQQSKFVHTPQIIMFDNTADMNYACNKNMKPCNTISHFKSKVICQFRTTFAEHPMLWGVLVCWVVVCQDCHHCIGDHPPRPCPTFELLIDNILLSMPHLVLCPCWLGEFYPYSCCQVTTPRLLATCLWLINKFWPTPFPWKGDPIMQSHISQTSSV